MSVHDYSTRAFERLRCLRRTPLTPRQVKRVGIQDAIIAFSILAVLGVLVALGLRDVVTMIAGLGPFR